MRCWYELFVQGLTGNLAEYNRRIQAEPKEPNSKLALAC